jgi:pyruvate dehydrogenase E1 component
MVEVLAAAELLERDYGVAVQVWSVTSYKSLHRDALDVERSLRLNPELEPRQNLLQQALADTRGPIVAASDYVKMLPASLSPFSPRPIVALGTDGFGRSDARAELRDHFEVDAKHIAYATLVALADQGSFDRAELPKVRVALGIDPDKRNPHSA